MEWFYFALLSAILFGTTTIIDKFNLSKGRFIKFPSSYITLFTSIIFVAVALISMFTGVQFILPHSLIGICMGFFWLAAIHYYGKAVTKGEISRVVSLIFVYPIVVVALSFLFLGEILSIFQYAGVILLVISALLVSYKKIKGKASLEPIIKFLVPVAIIWAVLSVMEKYLLFGIDYMSLLFWLLAGGFIGNLYSLIIFPNYMKSFAKFLKLANRKIPLIVFNGFISAGAYIALFLAISKGPVSLVSAVASLEPFFVFLITIFISIYFPTIFKEEINKSTVLSKILATVLIVMGTFLVTNANLFS